MRRFRGASGYEARVHMHKGGCVTRKEWPEGSFLFAPESGGIYSCEPGGYVAVYEKPVSTLTELRSFPDRGWILIPRSKDADARRRTAELRVEEFERERREEFDRMVEKAEESLREEAAAGHVYRIVITLRHIRDMDHAWAVMADPSLYSMHIENAVLEKVSMRKHPPGEEVEE